MTAHDNMNPQQFFHGSRAQLGVGDHIEPGHSQISNDMFSSPDHVYFSARRDTAQFFAQRMPADADVTAPPHVYTVQPMGKYGRDKNFDGRGAYQTKSPLRITGVDNAATD